MTPSEVDILQSFPWQHSDDSHGGLISQGHSADYSGIAPAPLAAMIMAGLSLVSGHDAFLRDMLVLAWSAVGMALFVTAMGRAAASEFCRESRVGVIAGLRYGAAQFRHSLLSTGIAALLVALPLTALALACWLLRLGLPQPLALAGWPVAIVLSVFLVLTATIVGTGWLLSLSAIATDRCSGADALSRGINYVLSHKLRTFFYLCLILGVASAAKHVAGLILLGGQTILEQRLQLTSAQGGTTESVARGLFYVEAWWQPVIYAFPAAIQCGVFFAGTTIAYVLLRQKEDAVRIRDMDSVR